MDKNGKDELLLKLHEQFSVNQNDTFGRYTTLFIALFALFGGYGIAFGLTTRLLKIGDYYVSPVLFLFLSLLLTIVLGFLIVSLMYIGYQHRRDQFMNGKIRKYFFIKEAKNEDGQNEEKQFEHFFGTYQGNKKSLISFIPDNILINISILGVLKIIVLFCILFVSFQSFSCPVLTPNCKKSPTQQGKDSIAQSCSVIICNNNQTTNDETKEAVTKTSNSTKTDVCYAMSWSIGGVLVIYSICAFLWFYFYRKYKKLEKDYDKHDLKDLIELFKEEKDPVIKENIKELILTIMNIKTNS